ncbi:MAG: chemotaxis protein CheW [Moorellales bacterium]
MAGGQYVTFRLGSETCAVDITYVQEIIRVPDMVRVPMAPAYVEGLANLRGTILPVLDARTRFGMARKDADEAARVMVLNDGGRRVGYIVDRVSEVVTVDDGQVDDIREESRRAELLRGVARMADGRLILLADAPALMQVEVGTMAARKDTEDYVTEGAAEGARAGAETEAEVQLVTFRLGREEFGLEIGAVQEIVRLPEVVNRVPNAPGYLLGVIHLRNRVLPVVSLGALLGLGKSNPDERCRVVVLNLPGRQVGLVVDAVAEVLRVSRSVIDPVPPLVRAQSGEEIMGVCKIGGGKRLVYLLDHDKLVSETDLVEFGEGASGPAPGEETGLRTEAEDHLVTFRLGREEFALDIARVREIIRVPDIVAVPKAPAFIEGVVNLRGTILPVIDLRKRFGLSTIARDERARVVVMETDGRLTGLIVDSVREVLKVPREDIEPPPELLTEVIERRFIRGIAKVARGERLVIVLDTAEVLSFREREELADFEARLDEAGGMPCGGEPEDGSDGGS